MIGITTDIILRSQHIGQKTEEELVVLNSFYKWH